MASPRRPSLVCQREGDLSLLGSPLRSCTQSNDGSTTGWARTGSCNWDPSDSGYHEVCVTMSQEFLEASARHDANDLSSVVQPGGHWCICAWAWASAVQRDPQNYEGITLDCERTNAKLREVYEMHISAGADLRSPSGAYYKAKAALETLLGRNRRLKSVLDTRGIDIPFPQRVVRHVGGAPVPAEGDEG